MALSEPALAAGMELVGEYEDSGYREPPHLVCRPDGQIVRLPALLYQVVRALNAPPAREGVVAEVAERLSRETGRQFTSEHVAFLIDKKLAPSASPPTATVHRRPHRAERPLPFLPVPAGGTAGTGHVGALRPVRLAVPARAGDRRSGRVRRR
ncbi:hypothetical protein ACFQ2B_07840 [Streptomyces stramineus]